MSVESMNCSRNSYTCIEVYYELYFALTSNCAVAVIIFWQKTKLKLSRMCHCHGWDCYIAMKSTLYLFKSFYYENTQKLSQMVIITNLISLFRALIFIWKYTERNLVKHMNISSTANPMQ